MSARRTQSERSESTRAALVAAALPQFVEHGFDDSPADGIVAAAGVTRGALYHHFGGKEGLFEVVFEQLEEELVARVLSALADTDDLWVAARTGITAFLEACTEPAIVRVALTDAPTVLGWERWREIEERHGLGLIRGLLEEAHRRGILQPAPVEALAELLFGALIQAALSIAHSSNPTAARHAAEQALTALLDGLRAKDAAHCVAPGGNILPRGATERGDGFREGRWATGRAAR